MDETKFWSLINEATMASMGRDDEKQELLDELQDLLEELPPEEIVGFQRIMRDLYWKAYTYNLSGAIFVILKERCDEDDFHGFRGWLISQGQQFFEQVVADPDSMAGDEQMIDDLYLPDILTLAEDAYVNATGDDMPIDYDFVEPEDLAGEPLELADLPQRLPNLCSEYFFVLQPDEEEAPAENT